MPARSLLVTKRNASQQSCQPTVVPVRSQARQQETASEE